MRDDIEITQANPLTRLWKVLSWPLSIIGLTSLSENIITLHGFIHSIVASYRSLVHPVFQLLFGWLELDISNWVFDYLFIGLIVGTSIQFGWQVSDSLRKRWDQGELDGSNIVTLGMRLDGNNNNEPNKTKHFDCLTSVLGAFVRYIFICLFLFVWRCVLWPFAIANVVLNPQVGLRGFEGWGAYDVYSPDGKNTITELKVKFFKRGVYQWLGAILLGTLIVLIINYALQFGVK